MTTYKVICDCCGRNITDATYKIKFELPLRYPAAIIPCCGDYSMTCQRIERTPKEYDLCGDCFDKAKLEFENAFLKKPIGAVIETRK